MLERLGTVAIIGVGLIGGSIGQALRSRGLAARVVGIGRDPARLAEAVQLGAIDTGTTELARGVDGAEVVVVCTPVTRIADDVRDVAEFGPEGVLITDAGSTKQRIVAAVELDPRSRACFVGGHPIAGSERKGVASAAPDLFDGKACILTPTENTPPERLQRARDFWSGLGCRLIELSPRKHDSALALTSHLPHAVAAALAGSIPRETLTMAAGAYRDGTRVAGSDGSLWAGIFRENRAPILESLKTFRDSLAGLESALEADDERGIIAWWEHAKNRRAHFDSLNDSGSLNR
ncbi:prephenate dehydrogenase [Singulisphaera sp. GP187]|uniref:prephenate dehydrogenase n=1 Tax=Singulisphaera sp. GP187 TaxID=1882752 RepID=UPI0020B13F9A|nr:prephenate dehydrogenase/arogenate dehydrogenase family protein [Singulisphaera sp. GP187]